MADDTSNQENSQSLENFLEVPWRGLRQDLQLRNGPKDPDGEPTWLVEDPVSGGLFKLGFGEKELFIRLVQEQKIDAALSRLYKETGVRPKPESIISFIKMLQKEGLAKLSTDIIQDNIRDPKPHLTPTQDRPQGQSFLKRVMHGYVYFRVPVLRPDRLLTLCFPWVIWLWSPIMRYIYLVIAVIGVTLTLQQFDVYTNAISHLFTPTGFIAFFLCLALLKIGHEFAHGFTAKSLGLHVRSMGVVFIVLWPILYTDTTDAWKLDNRRRRLLIDSAGMIFEFTIGAIALLLWAILPEGPVRSLMLFLSSSSIASSLLVNVNPFMRFDGYYVLMDWWGIDNLQPRAFALMKDSIRRNLLDWQGPVPEFHPQRKRMIFYAVLAAIYRLFIALVIAFAVYHLFFKTLGLLLLAIELWIFILRPIWREIDFIIKNKQYIGSRWKVARSAAVFGLIGFILSIPIPSIEIIPGLVLIKDANAIEAPARGMLSDPLPKKGTVVEEGQVLTTLVDVELTHQLNTLAYDIQITDKKLDALSTEGEEGGYRNWLLAEKKRLQSEYDKINQSIELLDVVAQSSGVIVDINNDLEPGSWLSRDTYMFTIATPTERKAQAYVHEHDYLRISKAGIVDAEIHFQDLETPSLMSKIETQTLFPVNQLPNEVLYDYAGGPIVAQREENNVQPRSAYYVFSIKLDDNPQHISHGTPCWVWLRGTYRSIVSKWINQIIVWFTREGFV